MSIPKLKPAARKAEAFTAEAPDAKREYKLRGRKQPLALNLPPDLIVQVDRFAAEDRRSRSNMIEIILGEYVKTRTARQEAA
jgi:hypothetical protein